mgnify:CR=1 FL=1
MVMALNMTVQEDINVSLAPFHAPHATKPAKEKQRPICLVSKVIYSSRLLIIV